MAIGAFRMMHAENRIREFAFVFFSELGCLSPERSMTFTQLRALGFGVTDAGLKYLLKNGVIETQDGKLYFDINTARRKIIRSIEITCILMVVVNVIIYMFVRSVGMHFISYIIGGISLVVAVPILAYVALPLRKLKK